MTTTTDGLTELLEKMTDGQPRVSSYNEYLKITGKKDTMDNFVGWSKLAYTMMAKPVGNA